MAKPLRTTTTVYVRIPNEIHEKISEEAARQAITKKEFISRVLNESVGRNLFLEELKASELRLKKFIYKTAVASVGDTDPEPPQESSEFDKATRKG